MSTSLFSCEAHADAPAQSSELFGNYSGRKHPDDGPLEGEKDDMDSSAMRVLALEKQDREDRRTEAEAEAREAATDSQAVTENDNSHAASASSGGSSPSAQQVSSSSS